MRNPLPAPLIEIHPQNHKLQIKWNFRKWQSRFWSQGKNLDETWELDMSKELLQLVVYPPKDVMVGCG